MFKCFSYHKLIDCRSFGKEYHFRQNESLDSELLSFVVFMSSNFYYCIDPIFLFYFIGILNFLHTPLIRNCDLRINVNISLAKE